MLYLTETAFVNGCCEFAWVCGSLLKKKSDGHLAETFLPRYYRKMVKALKSQILSGINRCLLVIAAAATFSPILVSQ